MDNLLYDAMKSGHNAFPAAVAIIYIVILLQIMWLYIIKSARFLSLICFTAFGFYATIDFVALIMRPAGAMQWLRDQPAGVIMIAFIIPLIFTAKALYEAREGFASLWRRR